jgi:hypothetical protein
LPALPRVGSGARCTSFPSTSTDATPNLTEGSQPMLPTLTLSLSLLLMAPIPVPPSATSTAGHSAAHVQPVSNSVDSGDREWAVQRPNRGVHARVVVAAATFPRSLRPWAACVLDRESGGTLDRRSSGQGARNGASSAAGRWQFLDRSWRRGLSYMVADRLVAYGMPKRQARAVRTYLAARNISKWPGWFQDIGFLEVVKRGGRFHWNGGSHSC